jgi:4-amino-4-deoxy-L-arabinose transferase-like glycosyltransferase
MSSAPGSTASGAATGGWLRAAAWWLTFATVAIIALAALRRAFFDLLGPLIGQFPHPYGLAGLLFTGAYVGGGVALLAAIWIGSGRAGDGRRRWILPAAIVLLGAAVRLAVTVAADAPMYGETRIIRDQALSILDGSCCFGHRPAGYPILLAGGFALFGVQPAVIEGLNLGFAAVTTWLVWEIGRAGWNRRVGAMAAGIYALVPSQVLLVLVPLTEPLYTLLLAVAVRLAMALDRRALVAAAVAGAALAAAQYVRSTAVALLLPVVALPFVMGRRWWPSIGRATLVVAVFLVLMTPVIVYNVATNDAVSVSTSSYGGWSLYVGANQEHLGRWNAEDAARLANFPGDTWWARSEYAGRVAIERMREDPVGYLRLMGIKLVLLWQDEHYAAAYAFTTGPPDRVVHVGWLTSALAWVALTVLAVIGVAGDRREPRPATLLIGMIVALVTITHLFLEVHGRYHSALVPLLGVLAAAGVPVLLRSVRKAWSRGRPAARPDSRSV